MSHESWKGGAENTQKGFGTAPQQPNESDQSFKDRVAGADWAKKQNGN